tara:strand:+ start:6739 stop:7074 length:336 start_codon:yes stop_codon:yes gene_type:complete
MMMRKNKLVVCQDGFSFSVQASNGSYCSPREDFAEHYTEVEIGYPSEKEPSIMEYCENPESPTETVYGYVPSDLVRHVIDKHGGIKTGEVPKGVPVYGATHSMNYDEDHSA